MKIDNRFVSGVSVFFLMLALGGGNCPSSTSGAGSGGNPPPGDTLKQTIKKGDWAAFKIQVNALKVNAPIEQQVGPVLLEMVNGDDDDKKQIADVMDALREEGVAVETWDVVKNSPAIQSAMCQPDAQSPKYYWTQIAHSAKIRQVPSIRAIVAADAKCPRVFIGTGNCPRLKVRAPADDVFKVTSCELETVQRPAKDTYAPWPVPDYNSKAIAIIGDTGCEKSQNCESPSSWPFATVAKTVADKEPNLIIHTGDYVYRKVDGSKDSWKVWEEEFFKPAEPMFSKAPFVLVRGNHEQCKDAPRGWFRFLAPGPYTGQECANGQKTLDQPYAIKWGDLKMLMLDSSAASDEKKDASMVTKLVEHLDVLNIIASEKNWSDVWLLTHRPAWACAPSWNLSSASAPFCPPSGLTVRAAWDEWRSRTPVTPIRKVLSGHVHLLSVADFKGDGPLQMIVGNSGAVLNNPWSSQTIYDGSRAVEENIVNKHFGFVVMNRAQDLLKDRREFWWQINAYDQHGHNAGITSHTHGRYVPIELDGSKILKH